MSVVEGVEVVGWKDPSVEISASRDEYSHRGYNGLTVILYFGVIAFFIVVTLHTVRLI